MTRTGFPHSDISGSYACTRLTGTFRSVPRPSSAPYAKASPICSYSLFTCDTEKLILSRYFTYASVNYTLELLSCARCHPPAAACKSTDLHPPADLPHLLIPPSPPTKQPGIPGLKRSHPKYRYLFYVITSSINFVFNPFADTQSIY